MKINDQVQAFLCSLLITAFVTPGLYADTKTAEVENEYEKRVQKAAQDFIDEIDKARAELEEEYKPLLEDMPDEQAQELERELKQMLEVPYSQLIADNSGENEEHSNNYGQLLKALGPELTNASGDSIPTDNLQEKDYVLLYFSAMWCPPCKAFTPRLVEFYEEYAEKGNLELVFYSADRSRESMEKYMTEYEMNWLAIPFSQREQTDLTRQYSVRGIPRLIVLDPAGDVVMDSQETGPTQVLEKLREEL